MAQWKAEVEAHLVHSLSLAGYVNSELAKSLELVAQPPPLVPLNAKFEFVLCIHPLAPIAKIMACLAGGGLVAVIIGTKLEWSISALRVVGGVKGAQVFECSPTQAMIRYADVQYTDNETDKLFDPGRKILAVVLFWVGG